MITKNFQASGTAAQNKLKSRVTSAHEVALELGKRDTYEGLSPTTMYGRSRSPKRKTRLRPATAGDERSTSPPQ